MTESTQQQAARERVERWLEKHGVAFEMQVARAFRAQLASTHLVWDVDLGRNYVDRDPTTQAVKLRETDVVVRATKVHHSGIWLSVWLVIECKSSRAEPWVFYRATNRIEPWARSLSETPWETVIDERLVEPNIGGWSDSALVLATVRNCYAAASANDPRQDRTKPNYARDAVQQAISAARGVSRDIPIDQHRGTAAIVIPAVITAAPMFAVELTSNGHKLIDTQREVVQVRHLPNDDALSKAWVSSAEDIDRLAIEFVNLVSALDYRL